MAEDIHFDYDFELVSIQLHLHNIRLEFGTSDKGLAVEFNGPFEVTRAGANVQPETIEAWDRLGDLRLIWPLVGVRMDTIIMDREFCRLIFKDGTVLEARNGPYPEIVNVWGPFGEQDRIYLTRYPADLSVTASNEVHDRVRQMLQQDPITFIPKIGGNK